MWSVSSFIYSLCNLMNHQDRHLQKYFTPTNIMNRQKGCKSTLHMILLQIFALCSFCIDIFASFKQMTDFWWFCLILPVYCIFYRARFLNLSIKYAKAWILHRSSMRICDVNTDNIRVIKASHTNVTVLCSLFRVSEQDYRDKEPARSGENRCGNGQEDIWDYDDSSVRNTVTATRPRGSTTTTTASIIIAAEITITTAVTTRITTATSLWLVMTTKTFYRSPREKMPGKKVLSRTV